MLSNKPYLIRAFYEWIVDSKCTPYIVVNATYPRCKIPAEFIRDGQVTLNISPDAVRDLKLGNEVVEFHASFSGVIHLISFPVKAVLAVHAHENGQGMFFDFEEEEDVDWDSFNPDEMSQQPSSSQNGVKQRASHLKLVE